MSTSINLLKLNEKFDKLEFFKKYYSNSFVRIKKEKYREIINRFDFRTRDLHSWYNPQTIKNFDDVLKDVFLVKVTWRGWYNLGSAKMVHDRFEKDKYFIGTEELLSFIKENQVDGKGLKSVPTDEFIFVSEVCLGDKLGMYREHLAHREQYHQLDYPEFVSFKKSLVSLLEDLTFIKRIESEYKSYLFDQEMKHYSRKVTYSRKLWQFICKSFVKLKLSLKIPFINFKNSILKKHLFDYIKMIETQKNFTTKDKYILKLYSLLS